MGLSMLDFLPVFFLFSFSSFSPINFWYIKYQRLIKGKNANTKNKQQHRTHSWNRKAKKKTKKEKI